MALVDILTPSLSSRAPLLAEAQASVARQTFRDIRHFCAVDSEGIGPGFLRNQLAELGTAPWIAFLDDDDLLDPEWVEWHLQTAERTQADLVYSPCRYPPGAPWRPPIIRFNKEALLASNYLPVTVLLRREAFVRAGGFRVTAPYEDWHLWRDLLTFTDRFEWFPHVSWTYRLHGHPWKPLR